MAAILVRSLSLDGKYNDVVIFIMNNRVARGLFEKVDHLMTASNIIITVLLSVSAAAPLAIIFYLFTYFTNTYLFSGSQL